MPIDGGTDAAICNGWVRVDDVAASHATNSTGDRDLGCAAAVQELWVDLQRHVQNASEVPMAGSLISASSAKLWEAFHMLDSGHAGAWIHTIWGLSRCSHDPIVHSGLVQVMSQHGGIQRLEACGYKGHVEYGGLGARVCAEGIAHGGYRDISVAHRLDAQRDCTEQESSMRIG